MQQCFRRPLKIHHPLYILAGKSPHKQLKLTTMVQVFWIKHESDATIVGVSGFAKRTLLGKETMVSDKSSTTFLRTDKVRNDIKVGQQVDDIVSITDGVPKWKK